jgi:glyoxylase I family protein
VTPAPIDVGLMNHVALPSANPERSAQFYRDVLGFTITSRPSFSFRGAWLHRRDVGVMIHLIHDAEFQPRREDAINTRGTHVAMHVDDYDAAIAALRNFGVELVERKLPDYGYRQAFFRDPDGNVLELGEWPPVNEMF